MTYNTPYKIELYAEEYVSLCYDFIKTAKIRKLPNGKWRVLSEKGKNLGTYDSRGEAVKRLQQVEFFKHRKANDDSYSSVMRTLNQDYSKDVVLKFQKEFKKHFDEALIAGDENPENVAMEIAMSCISVEDHTDAVKKQASAINLGDPEFAGKYLADLLRFLLKRISIEKRQKSINTMKRKIYYLNEYQIAGKKVPPTSSMGQSIVLLKNVLLDHSPSYIRSVLNSIVRHL